MMASMPSARAGLRPVDRCTLLAVLRPACTLCQACDRLPHVWRHPLRPRAACERRTVRSHTPAVCNQLRVSSESRLRPGCSLCAPCAQRIRFACTCAAYSFVSVHNLVEASGSSGASASDAPEALLLKPTGRPWTVSTAPGSRICIISKRRPSPRPPLAQCVRRRPSRTPAEHARWAARPR